ncbi:MAG: hypothetical protein NTW40_01590 [Acidobacteria bacterium]|nr:hypothetical protein [Acidobacteriota bacterium]
MSTEWSSFMQDLEQRYQAASGLNDRAFYKIFYGPVRPAPVLLLGINPGGDPAEVAEGAVKQKNGSDSAASAGYYENDECDLLDCDWRENTGLKKILLPLFEGDENRIRAEVVKTNLAFRRSKTKTGIDFERAKQEAAPFLSEIIGRVRPRLVLLTSLDVTSFVANFGSVLQPVVAPERDPKVGQIVFEAAKTMLCAANSEALVVRVAHASQFNWTYERYGVVERIQALVAL